MKFSKIKCFQLDQRTDAVVVLNMIQSALAETKWVSHMQLILAKVPILRIRFYEPFTDITVDLNANNSVAIRNTHLLCYYSSCKFYFLHLLFLLYLLFFTCTFLRLMRSRCS